MPTQPAATAIGGTGLLPSSKPRPAPSAISSTRPATSLAGRWKRAGRSSFGCGALATLLTPSDYEGMAGARSAPGRVATNTIARAAGEAVAKVASLAFYVVMARELGTHGYGSYVFALALTGTLLIAAGFGTDELIARQVARDHSRAGYYLANVGGLKAVTSVGLLAIAMAVVFIGGFRGRGAAAGVPL